MPEGKVTLPNKLAVKATAATSASRYPKNATIPDSNVALYNSTIRSLRGNGAVSQALRLMVRKEGTLSSAVFNFVEIANSGLTVKAYDTKTNQFSVEATRLAESLMSAMNTLDDYSAYSDQMTVDQLVETALRETVVTSQCAGELVLDEAQLPSQIVLVPFESLKWESDGDGGKYPVQKGTYTADGEDVPLNIPSFWVSTLHQDLTTAYATSIMEPSLDSVYYFEEFIEDMRRVVRKSGHSRTLITLDSEKVAAAAPASIQKDSTKMQAFMNKVMEDVRQVAAGLEPEDALVIYDTAKTELLAERSVKEDYTGLLETLSGQLATSLKSHPSILGLRLEGSQSLSNTESLLFIKGAKALQRPVKDVLSRAMTLAVRLYGVDAYVKVGFNPINLRPEEELEAYRAMKQARVLELLSLGFMTDEEASIILQTGERPPGSPALSGTMFYQKDNTLSDEVAMTNGSQESALVPKTPDKAGGKSQ